jgi:hypothetical protein
MPILDRDISFVPPDRVTFSDAAMKQINDGLSTIVQSSQEKEWIAVMNLGSDGPWLAFDTSENISIEGRRELRNGILVSMPIRLEEREVLDIDCHDREFFFTNVDVAKLIPDHVRSAFGER